MADKIDSKRYQAIESVVESLHQCVEKYGRSDYVCVYNSSLSFQCGSFLLGGMTKELSRLGLKSPRPEIPFPGLSCKKLCKLVQGMNSPRWSPEASYYAHECTLETAWATLIRDVSNALGGLDLGDLKNVRNE